MVSSLRKSYVLTFPSPNGTLEPLERPGGGNFGNAQMTNHGSGGRTPAWGGPPSRTPNPYAEGGKTPAWNAASRTPNPYADSGKTPAWNASSRTPNPYAQDGGRTPAWNASARTPNPYASGGGAATGGWGGATPKPTAGAWGDSSWGGGGGSSPGWSGGASAWVCTGFLIEISLLTDNIFSHRAHQHQEQLVLPRLAAHRHLQQPLRLESPITGLMIRQHGVPRVVLHRPLHQHLPLVHLVSVHPCMMPMVS